MKPFSPEHKRRRVSRRGRFETCPYDRQRNLSLMAGSGQLKISRPLLILCKLFKRNLCSSLPKAVFQTPRITGHAIAAKPVDDRDEKIKLERTYLAVIYNLSCFREIDIANDGGERGVFEQIGRLGDQRGNHIAQRLRQDNVTHCLSASQPTPNRGFDLAVRHRLNSSANYFRQIGRFKDDESSKRNRVFG